MLAEFIADAIVIEGALGERKRDSLLTYNEKFTAT